MTHFVLYVLLASGGYSQKPFPTYADCYQVQQVVGGACVEVDSGGNPMTQPLPPLEKTKPLIKRDIGTVYNGSQL